MKIGKRGARMIVAQPSESPKIRTKHVRFVSTASSVKSSPIEEFLLILAVVDTPEIPDELQRQGGILFPGLFEMSIDLIVRPTVKKIECI